MTENKQPPLLNPNTDVNFRNSVIHKGYIPKKDETIKYAETVLNLIEEPLIKLKKASMDIVKETYKYYSPERVANETKKKDDDLFVTNILTTVDVLRGREDYRAGDIPHQLKRIEDNRVQKKLRLMKELPKDIKK